MSKLISQAVEDVLKERDRQIHEEGWTLEHDDRHVDYELARAGAAYAILNFQGMRQMALAIWPFHRTFLKRRGLRRNLVRATALLIAEIERLDRLEKKSS